MYSYILMVQIFEMRCQDLEMWWRGMFEVCTAKELAADYMLAYCL
jgi:hypothetical protein